MSNSNQTELESYQNTIKSAYSSYSSSTQSASSITDQICLPFEEKYAQGDTPDQAAGQIASDTLHTLWSTLADISSTLPFQPATQQQQFLGLLATLKQRPAPSIPTQTLESLKQSNIAPWSYSPIWSQLATWSWTTREKHDQLRSQADSPTSTPWLNFNAILARLSAAQISDENFLGWAMMTGALDKNDAFLIPAAAIWAQFAGTFWAEEGWSGDRPNFRIGREELELWRGAFVNLLSGDGSGSAVGLDGETKSLVEGAVESLNQALGVS